MAGIYIHVPFCRKACTYCNFHFSTNLDRKEGYLKALLKEIEVRDSFLSDVKINSIYLGGGTPSVLSARELQLVFSKLAEHYDLSGLSEVTLEANPDDLNKDYIGTLAEVGINRLSIGVQSFNDKVLKWMNRSHSAKQAHLAIEWALAAGFNQLTADLIYGIPMRSLDEFSIDLENFSSYGVPHFSAYALTVEPKTILAHRIRKKTEMAPREDEVVRQFEFLMDWATEKNYEHYEISNFALPGQRAVHNSSYWKGIPYLGLGPSAHSFDGQNRYWNIANNAIYEKKLFAGELPLEMEGLSPENHYNEYLMTALRLIEGVDREKALSILPEAKISFDETRNRLEKSGLLKQNKRKHFQLTKKGKLLADYIASEFMVVD